VKFLIQHVSHEQEAALSEAEVEFAGHADGLEQALLADALGQGVRSPMSLRWR
jgi:hypothetical protein